MSITSEHSRANNYIKIIQKILQKLPDWGIGSQKTVWENNETFAEVLCSKQCKISAVFA